MSDNGFVDPSRPSPNSPDDASIIIYGYVPSLALSVIGIAFFVILLLAHTVQIIRHRLWSYIPIAFACLLEVFGYNFRYRSSHIDPYRVSYFVGQYFCITVAPVFISASLYIYLTKLANWAETQGLATGLMRRIGSRTVIWTFVGADVLCTCLQVTGAAMIGARTSKHQDPSSANFVLVGGLAAQTLFFGLFLVLLASLARAMSSTWTVTKGGQFREHGALSVAIGCLAGVAVMVRTVFRLIESAEGVFGYLSSHEVFFATLEFAPIIIAALVLAVWTPSRFDLQTKKKQGAARIVSQGSEVELEIKPGQV